MNLYDELCSYENLYLAYRKAKKNKTVKWYVKKFEENLGKNLLKIESELRIMTYKPHPLKSFIIRDPKTRVISSSHFRDRVVHHAICNIIEPIFEKSFIYDSYASRKGKGTHAALKRFDEFKRKVSRNGSLVKGAKDGNMIIGYVLKADVKHYFDTVDHNVLLAILGKKIKNDKLLVLIKCILDNHMTKEHGKGMPIGNLTSQFLANVYLSELDCFVKHKLRAKFYIRYLDDFIILHRKKKILEMWKEKINEFLINELRLELHPEKSKIYQLSKGINFLGFRIFYYHKLLKKSNTIAIRKRLTGLTSDYRQGLITKQEIKDRVNGWRAYAMHGNTYKLRRQVINHLKKFA